MQRRTFLHTISGAAAMMTLNELEVLAETFGETDALMPALFVGHGSPMNAIEDNEFRRGWQKTASELPTPKAILCVSAHWETRGTFITAMPKPRTIHDFYGFPQALFDVQYSAPGSPELATETSGLITKTTVGLDHEWGLDHGCWSVVRVMYPNANIPVLQLSLDATQPPEFHYELAKQLMPLRKKGILIIGSGNIVHNLRMMQWGNKSGFSWAEEFNEKIKKAIANGDHKQVVNYHNISKDAKLAVPTNEHFLPLLYTLGLQTPKDTPHLFNDQTMLGSISMTSVIMS